jgi:HEPN domain-containing protein
VLHGSGQYSQACFLAQQAGEKALKALLAAEDRDLRTHSLTGLLRELGEGIEECWRVTARQLDKLYVPTRYPDALGDEAPMDVFGPEDAEAAIGAAEPMLAWVNGELDPSP